MIKIIIGVVVVILIIIMLTGYVKAPPDTAYIISGLHKKSRVLIGQAGIKIPFFERLDKINLKLIPLDIKTKDSIPTADYINIYVDSAVNVKIKDSPEAIAVAAQNFLNKKPEEIGEIVSEVLEGNIREIVCGLSLKLLVSDRKTFVAKVADNVIPDLEKMGLELVSFNVQNFRDENNVIEDLGIDNISQIRKDASIAKANADKEVAVAKALADKEANDTRIKVQTEIAEKENELEIRKAELRREADIKKAEADAAYKIQEQVQEKSVQTETINAQIAKAEKEAVLNQHLIELEQRKLEAEVNKHADAKKYEVAQAASAELDRKQKEATAKKFEMLQEAEGIKAKGAAEAEAIRAKGIAEAEAMEKKAEAMRKYGQAAMMQMIVEVLPEIAKSIAEPLSAIDKVTIIDGGNGKGESITSLGNCVPSVLAKTIETVKETTGLDLVEVMKANTYDAKVNRNLNIVTENKNKQNIQDGPTETLNDTFVSEVKDTLTNDN